MAGGGTSDAAPLLAVEEVEGQKTKVGEVTGMDSFFKWLTGLIESGDPHLFYVSSRWLRKREEILRMDRYECQLCKQRGRYRKAELVHHVNHVKDRPDLALSDEFIGMDGARKRQLISVCRGIMNSSLSFFFILGKEMNGIGARVCNHNTWEAATGAS